MPNPHRYAIVNPGLGTVINVVEFAGGPPPTHPPPGYGPTIIGVQSDDADTRWTWNGTALVPPAPVIPPGTPEFISGQAVILQLTQTDCQQIRSSMIPDEQLWQFWFWLASMGVSMNMSDPFLTGGWGRLAVAITKARANAIATALSMPSLIIP